MDFYGPQSVPTFLHLDSLKPLKLNIICVGVVCMNTESVANADAHRCLAPCIQGWGTSDRFYLCQKIVHPPMGPRDIGKTSKGHQTDQTDQTGTKCDLERLVSVGRRHLLCVSFSVDVRTLAPVVSLLLGCLKLAQSPMTIVRLCVLKDLKSGQHLYVHLLICSVVPEICTVSQHI